MIALAATLLLFGATKTLNEAVNATDSATKVRGAYALGRAFDPDDQTQTALVQRMIVTGHDGQREALVRGIVSRSWPGGMPEWFVSRIPDLLRDSGSGLEPVIEWLPHETVIEIALQREREHYVSGPSLLSLAIPLDDERLQKAVRERERLRATGLLFFQEKCRPVECAQDFALLAWLHEDLSHLFKRFEDKTLGAPHEDLLALSWIRAAGGDSRGPGELAAAASTWIDPTLRLRALAFLWSMPKEPRPEAVAAALRSLREDGDGRVRSYAATRLSALAGRSGSDGAIAEGLTLALKDGTIDVRLEAAAGLLRLGAGKSEMAEAAKKEQDLAVRALMETGSAIGP